MRCGMRADDSRTSATRSMASERAREASRVEFTSSARAWPRLTVPLLTLGVAWLLRGSPGVPAVLSGWVFVGIRAAFGMRYPRRLLLGASEVEPGPGTLHLRWADIDQIVVSQAGIGWRRVRILMRGSAAALGEVHALCTAAEGAAICDAALEAGGLHSKWSVSVRPRGLRRGLLHGALGGVLYGSVALAFGRAPAAALLAALTFALFAALACLVTELGTWPSAKLAGVVLNGVAVISFPEGGDGA
jgi:hypothetical protein